MNDTYKGYKIEVAGMRPIRWKLRDKQGCRMVPYYSATKWVDGQIEDHFTEDTMKELKDRISEKSRG